MVETSLHQYLKKYFANNNGSIEVPVDGYLIDVIKDDTLYEIQIKNFYTIRPKLERLLNRYKVKIIYPIPKQCWIIVLDKKREKLIRKRKSPKKGRIELIFSELIYIPDLLSNPNFSIQVIFTNEEELRMDDGKGSWRRKRVSKVDRCIISIESTKDLFFPVDYLRLIPFESKETFSNRDLAEKLNLPIRLARKMSYCLRSVDLIRIVGKRGNELIYKKNSSG
jgi:hypothetical protein